jgi:hypothetical protein
VKAEVLQRTGINDDPVFPCLYGTWNTTPMIRGDQTAGFFRLKVSVFVL